ncbi:Ser-Thr-rich GPI-anchored membrane family protein [Bacteroidota bacterium]
MIKLLTGTFLIFVIQLSYGQRFENIQARIENDVVTVSYDIVSPFGIGVYQVDIYSSHNNYNSPLQMVLGDVGNNIAAGMGKSITWQIASELGQYDGMLNFELRGHSVRGSNRDTSQPAKLTLLTPNASSQLKTGREYQITWAGGGNTQRVNVQLHKKKRKVHDIATNWDNTGSLNFKVPGQLGSNGQYWIKITDANDATTAANTPYFRITNTRKNVYNFGLAIITIAALIAIQSGNAK